jgi:hypothetical protein
MDKRKLILVNDDVRLRAMEAVRDAPEGHSVTISPPGRSLDQNAMLWPLLECFSKQLLWPVNGEMCKLEPEEWKDILTAAHRQETVRLAMGLSGGMVMLGLRTSKMTKMDFSEFIEFILATAAQRGVDTGE